MSVKYDKMVTVKMTTEEADQLKEIASAYKTSQGTIIRQAIEDRYKIAVKEGKIKPKNNE